VVQIHGVPEGAVQQADVPERKRFRYGRYGWRRLEHIRLAGMCPRIHRILAGSQPKQRNQAKPLSAYDRFLKKNAVAPAKSEHSAAGCNPRPAPANPAAGGDRGVVDALPILFGHDVGVQHHDGNGLGIV